ncbi:MAG: hypothetical protein JO083_08980 [Candidatus Eremiobacteraeota bacterium]|nr:hypothetical protein [Candidatus Eremiobacteraeota bacterium]
MKHRPFVPLALAALLAAPLAAHADPLSVFQPAQVRAVSVSPADVRAIRSLPPLEAFGTVSGTRVPGVDEVTSASEAARDAGYALRLPAAVPGALAKDVHYEVTQRARTSFTFSQAKAAAWARDHKVALHPLPGGLDGATYTATLRPIAVVTYGKLPHKRTRHAPPASSFLAVVQAPLPTITSSGAPLRALTDWFAAQPGISPRLVAQIKALGDPAQTLPIPVRFNEQTAAKISVDGVQGLAIGDETGIGTAIVWTKDGKLYAVAGTFPQSEVLALANGLK